MQYYIQNVKTKKFYTSWSDSFVKNWLNADGFTLKQAKSKLFYEKYYHPRLELVIVKLEPKFVPIK